MADRRPRLTPEQRDAHDLARRREVVDLPMVPLRRHAWLMPSDTDPEWERQLPVTAGIGPSGEAAAVWSSHRAPGRYRVTRHGGPHFDAELPFGPNFVQPLPDGRTLLVAGRAFGGAANGEVRGPDGEPLALEHVGDAVEHVLATDAGEVWVGYFDEAAAGGRGLGGHGLVRFSGDLAPVWRHPVQGLLPRIYDCYALNVEGERAAICAYPEFRLVTFDGDRAVDRGRVGRRGAKGLLVSGDRAALVGGYGPERDLVTPLRVTPDGIEQEGPQSRLVLPDASDLDGFRIACRGADLHLLVRTGWYRVDLERLLAG